MCQYSPDLVFSLQSSYISNSKRDLTDFFLVKFHSWPHNFRHRLWSLVLYLWQGLVCSADGPLDLGQLCDDQFCCSILLVVKSREHVRT